MAYYQYQNHRGWVFTDQGQRQFLAIREHTFNLLKLAGVARVDKIIAGQTGDTFDMLACIDRMVELEEIVEIPQTNVPGQGRIYERN